MEMERNSEMSTIKAEKHLDIQSGKHLEDPNPGGLRGMTILVVGP